MSGGGLARIGGAVVLADVDGDRLVAIDPDRREVTGTLPLGSGAHPGRMAADDDGTGFVVLRGAGELLAFSSVPMEELWRIAICAAPTGVAWDPLARSVRVACASGHLVTVDPDGAVTDRVVVEPDLRDVVVEDGRIWLSTFRDAAVLRVDGDGAIQDRLRPADTTFLGASGASRAAVAWALVPRAGGGVTLLHQWRTLTTLVVADDGEAQAYGGGCGTVVLGGVTTVEPDGVTSSLAALSGAPLAVDLAPAEGGWDLAVAGAPAERGAGWLPAGFPAAPECTALETSLPASDHTVAVLRDAAGIRWTLGRQPLELRAGGQRVALPDPSAEADPAFALFHQDAGGGLTCASCHPEAGEDGQVWSFDVGERRTQTLRASLLATAPYHWDGEFGTLGALMDEVLVGRMGGEPATSPEIARLLEWLDALPPSRSAESPDPDLADRGAERFVSAGCADCHVGTTWTDGRAHDVGTGGSFQTPSLLGVAARAPFLHDGCATTLRDRFGPCGGDRHGDRLDEADVTAVVAFLETL